MSVHGTIPIGDVQESRYDLQMIGYSTREPQE